MGFQVVHIDGKTSFERGRQHGEAARSTIEKGIQRYQERFETRDHVSWRAVQEKAMRFVPFLEKDYADLLDEIRGIAAGSGMDFEDMMVLNTRYELLKFPIQECTTFSLMPEVTADHHTYQGMNWDNVGWMRDSSILLHVEEPNGMKYICMTEAGQLIRHGFNNYGIGICTNNLLSTGDRDEVGVPTNFMRRRVLTSRTLEEATESIRKSPRAISCNLMVASSIGDATDFEVNPVHSIEIKPNAGIMTHANHFTVDRKICREQGGKFRDVRLYSLLEREKGAIDLAYIQKCLTDHYKADPTSHEAICKHTPKEGESIGINPIEASVTIASQIYDLTTGTAYICYGNPCGGNYVKYEL